MELSKEQINKIEEYIAYEGAVILANWIETSAHGFKVQLSLSSRAELDPFDKTMKRSKKRGGQRYQMILQGDQPIQMEALFCGRGWSETKGAHIALHIPDIDDQRFFRGLNTIDQGDVESAVWWNIMLLEVGEDEIIINQKRRDKADPVPVGGPRSKAVAILLQDPDFALWMDRKSIHADTGETRTVDQRDSVVKNRCGFKSKVELDNGNEQAWQLWERQFHGPFIKWMGRAGNR